MVEHPSDAPAGVGSEGPPGPAAVCDLLVHGAGRGESVKVERPTGRTTLHGGWNAVISCGDPSPGDVRPEELANTPLGGGQWVARFQRHREKTQLFVRQSLGVLPLGGRRKSLYDGLRASFFGRE